MAETVDEIVLEALMMLKVKQSGESLTASEATDGRKALNNLLGLWNNQTLMQPAKVQVSQALTSNDGTYTFGTGGDNSTRPMEIFSAYVRSNNTDYPIKIISNEEYSDITFKSISSSYPFNLYFRKAYPLATIELYPIPSTNSMTLFLECRAALSEYTAGSDEVNLPDGYIFAIKHQLAINISPQYRKPDEIVFINAKDGIAWIKRNNNQDKPSMLNTARRAVRRGSGYGYRYFGAA